MESYVIPTEKAHIPLLAFDVEEGKVEQIRKMVMRVLVAKVNSQLWKV